MSETRTPVPTASTELPVEAQKLIVRLRLCYIATASLDGEPNISPKGSLKVLDARHVAFADMASPRTIENLRENPRLEINAVDPFARRGYRIRGTAEITEDPRLMEVVSAGLGAEYPVKQAVLVTISEVRTVESPVYLFLDANPAEVERDWEANYGYRKV